MGKYRKPSFLTGLIKFSISIHFGFYLIHATHIINSLHSIITLVVLYVSDYWEIMSQQAFVTYSDKNVEKGCEDGCHTQPSQSERVGCLIYCDNQPQTIYWFVISHYICSKWNLLDITSQESPFVIKLFYLTFVTFLLI